MKVHMNNNMQKSHLVLAALLCSTLMPLVAMENEITPDLEQEVVVVEKDLAAWYKKETVQRISSVALVTGAMLYTAAVYMNKVISPVVAIKSFWAPKVSVETTQQDNTIRNNAKRSDNNDAITLSAQDVDSVHQNSLVENVSNKAIEMTEGFKNFFTKFLDGQTEDAAGHPFLEQ